MKEKRSLQWLASLSVLLTVGISGQVFAQAWTPQRHIEFIAPAGAAGALDTFTRTVERIAREMKLIPASSSVSNKPGGEHAVAYNYLHQKAGDPHVLSLSSPVLLTNHITGVLPITYTDFTPVSTMMTEYYLFLVRPDSPFKTPADLIEAVRQRPESVSLAAGNQPQRMAVGAMLMAAGMDIKRAKIVTISGAKVALTVAGGHVDAGVAAPGQALPMIQAGTVRALAVSAPRRLGGTLASVPTWTEAGFKEAEAESWRTFIAAKGLTDTQLAYWENVMRRVAESAEMRAVAEKQQWDIEYKDAAQTRKFLETDYARQKRLMTYMGMTR
jgi:putative tricarboxylic transport membrane protein